MPIPEDTSHILQLHQFISLILQVNDQSVKPGHAGPDEGGVANFVLGLKPGDEAFP